MSQPAPRAAGRADRILDAAGALLLRLGYRKVTIEDIARHADVGKGTVYLHWRTKRELFEALLRRESMAPVEALLDRLRRDPAEVRPHRLSRGAFLDTHRSPLLAALVTGDTDVVGALRDGPLGGQDLLATDQFFAVLTRHGLLRTDLPNLALAMQATAVGFHLVDAVEPGYGEIDLDARADALAHTVRCAFEPPGDPDPAALAAAAAELSAMFENLITGYRKWIYAAESG
ncbi:DNA-binding transcriptional regulator, AcrR family [Amycolatopsis arida]|uniref:DNA-binding transcriptional regulator, AcrR family n=1 Tax=Amycolatopsis arida TaxID=587909 RepID=A0A1I5ZB84_9PSEU|nr:TetR/AcrR family transcriptional regulator [Amycolatopsis arida]TDX89482.1 AcrR family transcriptional regulator [Amycolatopsis arida]SFQ53703.1 DNA-binding transcriptional regulator, AcrR family [Amycolatopsis arida]